MYHWRITGKDEQGFPKGRVSPPIHWVVDSLECEWGDEYYPEVGHWETERGERVDPGTLHTGELRGVERGLRRYSLVLNGERKYLARLFKRGLKEPVPLKLRVGGVEYAVRAVPTGLLPCPAPSPYSRLTCVLDGEPALRPKRRRKTAA